jgi:branched-chain amino acid transport system substrate-binding protein
MILKKIAMTAALALAFNAYAANEIKVGLMTTLSGPAAALGTDIRDGFNLAVKHLNQQLGGLPARVIIADDAQNPDTARQIADRFTKRDRVDIATGIVFSNILLATAPAFFRDNTFYVSANAGPSEYAGAQCNPFFFNVAWQNDNLHEAMGKHMQDKGVQRAVLLAPNYPAGRDALNGVKRYYKGSVVEEISTRLGQLDYAAEIAQIRSLQADALYIFLPGGMGINFIKQYAQSGLMQRTPLFAPAFSSDEDTVGAVGAAMEGVVNSTHWYREMDNAVNTRFVADFQKEYGRLPTLYAAQGYDAGLFIDAAVKAVGGKLDNKDALRNAMRTVKAPSTRGAYKMRSNHYPEQAYYLREVAKNPDGSLSNRFVSKIADTLPDAYIDQCKMPN